MSNLRQKYTDEEWEELCNSIMKKELRDYNLDTLEYKLEMLRRDRTAIDNEISRIEEIIKVKINAGESPIK